MCNSIKKIVLFVPNKVAKVSSGIKKIVELPEKIGETYTTLERQQDGVCAVVSAIGRLYPSWSECYYADLDILQDFCVVL